VIAACMPKLPSRDLRLPPVPTIGVCLRVRVPVCLQERVGKGGGVHVEFRSSKVIEWILHKFLESKSFIPFQNFQGFDIKHMREWI
jgi:hypothetical protein